MKVCIDCNIEKEYKDFYKRKDNKDGYRNNCKSCQNIKNKPGTKRYFEKESTIEYRKEYNKNYWIENSDELKEKNKERYYENQEAYLLQKKEYYSNNREIMVSRSVNYAINRLKVDPIYKFRINTRSSILKIFKDNGYTKSKKTEEILCISILEFVNYIESKFEDWMTWENRGLYNGELNYGWDIDHIIPISSGNTEEEIIKLNHYSNLQPLCSKVNRDIKRDRLDYEKAQ